MFKDLRQNIRARRAAALAAAEASTQAAAGEDALYEAPRVPEPPPRGARVEALLADLAPRQPALHALLESLDAWQLQAVLADDPALLVRAQVGSGKTRVLAHKVLWLHLGCGVPLERIAVLTFTNRAAGEISARIGQICASGRPRPQQMWLMGTFHGVALTLLRGALPVERLGFRRDFRVMDSQEKEALWLRLIGSHELNIKHRRQLERRLQRLDEGELLFGNMRQPDDIEALAELIQAEKVRVGLMDFDDLLLNTQALLALQPLDPPPAWIVVDELQDCNLQQLELTERLAGPETRLFAVGDANQVIYGWRGSSLGVFEAFEQQHKARVLGLPANYRCSGNIVACARAFLAGSGPIAQAQTADLHGLVATRAAGEPLDIIRHHDERAEAAWLAGHVQQRHAAGVAWSELAIMTRTRRQLGPLRAALADANVPVNDVAAADGQLPVLRWLLQLLRSGLNPADGEGARAALTHADWGALSATTLSPRRVRETEEALGLHGLAAVTARARAIKRLRRQDDRELALDVLRRLANLGAWLARQRDHVDAEAVLRHLRVSPLLRPTAANHAALLQACRSSLDDWLYEAGLIGGSRALALAEVLGGVALGRQRRPKVATTDGVSLLTIHAAKGLEFDHVYVCGANEGLLPIAGAVNQPAGLAEERRLFFVALTRARETVTLTWLASPGQLRVVAEPGPFLRLLPQDLVRWHDGPPVSSAAPVADATGPSPRCLTTPVAAVSARPAFATGDRVRHKRYGVGVVGAVDDAAVHAHFEGFGDKRFLLAMCPLQRVMPPSDP